MSKKKIFKAIFARIAVLEEQAQTLLTNIDDMYNKYNYIIDS